MKGSNHRGFERRKRSTRRVRFERCRGHGSAGESTGGGNREQARHFAALEEGQKLARELHDSVSQALYRIVLGARTARTLLDRDPTQAAQPLDYILSPLEAGLAEMRALIFELRPESLQTEGLVAALGKLVNALGARYQFKV